MTESVSKYGECLPMRSRDCNRGKEHRLSRCHGVISPVSAPCNWLQQVLSMTESYVAGMPQAADHPAAAAGAVAGRLPQLPDRQGRPPRSLWVRDRGAATFIAAPPAAPQPHHHLSQLARAPPSPPPLTLSSSCDSPLRLPPFHRLALPLVLCHGGAGPSPSPRSGVTTRPSTTTGAGGRHQHRRPFRGGNRVAGGGGAGAQPRRRHRGRRGEGVRGGGAEAAPRGRRRGCRGDGGRVGEAGAPPRSRPRGRRVRRRGRGGRAGVPVPAHARLTVTMISAKSASPRDTPEAI